MRARDVHQDQCLSLIDLAAARLSGLLGLLRWQLLREP